MDTDLKKQLVPIANKESPSREPCETSDTTESGMDVNTPYDIYALSSQVMEFRVLALITDDFNSTPFDRPPRGRRFDNLRGGYSEDQRGDRATHCGAIRDKIPKAAKETKGRTI